MPETTQPDWGKIAEARGIPAGAGVVKSLDGLERDFALVRAALDWRDEPVTIYRAADEEAAR